MEPILEQTFLGNLVLDYLICAGMFVIGIIAVKILQLVLIKRMEKWAKKTETKLDDFLITLVKKIALPLAYIAVLYMSIKTLTLPPGLNKGVEFLGMGILTVLTVRLVLALIGYGFAIYKMKRGGDEALERSLKGILGITKLIIWGIAIVFFLDNLGFKISAVIAGLGIGGVAIALAAQAILGDLFSYFSIIFDRPFEIGDFIIIGDYLGCVEYVGIKTTRIRSLGGEQLIFSNTDLTNSRVRNYKRMEKRRVVFKLGVVYQTPLEKLKEIPKVIEKVIKGVKDTGFDRAHFFSYADFSLVFEVVYYVMSGNYNKYMDVQQEINFRIHEEFTKMGVEFAYPTQTVYVSK